MENGPKVNQTKVGQIIRPDEIQNNDDFDVIIIMIVIIIQSVSLSKEEPLSTSSKISLPSW